MTAVLEPTAAAIATPIAGRAAVASVPVSTAFRRRALGVSIVVGAAVSAAGFAATVWEEGDQKIDYLNSLVVNPEQSQLAAVLLHFGYMFFVPVLLVLAAMTRASRSKLTTLGFGLAGLGALSLPGLLVTDFYDLAIRQTLPDDLAVQTSDKASSYAIGAIMTIPTVLALLAGLIITMVAAARTRFIPWALLPVFVAGFLAPMFCSGLGWFANVVPTSVALGALALVGVRALRMSDSEFATGVRA